MTSGLVWGLLPQAARALGQRLSQTGSVQHGAPQAMGLEPV